MGGEWKVGICDVHKILDNDERPRNVQHCGYCNANICRDCLYSGRRVRAFLKSKGLSLEAMKVWLRTNG